MLDEVGQLRREIRSLRRWIGGLAVAVAVLGVAAAVRSVPVASAQPAPPAAKSISFVDGDKQVDLDASGLRITRAQKITMAITADHLTATAGDSSIDLAATGTDAHVKALSDLGSTSLVATPKSLCFAIRQIGGKDSYTCIPPVK